jgi:hypothetical protein
MGTVHIAERLGKFKRHPRVWNSELELFEPVPLLGDLMLFLVDTLGPYCVEWDTKRNEGDHGKPMRRAKNGWSSTRELAKASFKDELRVACLEELAIPIVRIHHDTFDATLRRNLGRMFCKHASPSPLSAELQAEIIEEFRAVLPAAQPPIKVVAKFTKRGVSSANVTEVLDQAIWDRRLDVDLFRLVDPSQPLYPQQRDPYEVYSHLFQR